MSYYGAPKHLSNASDSRRRAIQTRRERYPHWGRPNLKEYRGWQAQAYRFVKLAIGAGVLPDLACGEYACVDCGAVATQYEHRDYARPLDVEPICKGCNLKRGRGAWPTAEAYSFKKIEHD